MGALREVLAAAKYDLLLVSPFVKSEGTTEVIEVLRRQPGGMSPRVRLFTNLHPDSILRGTIDLRAIFDLGRSIPRFELVHLPSLHAKVYIADQTLAVVTSANLTRSGISGNLEYGIALTEGTVVREIRRDFDGYSQLGAKIDQSDLENLVQESEELKESFKKADRSIEGSAKRALASKLNTLTTHLLEQRAKGRTTHSIFSETILYLLGKGPLQTVQLHQLIQQVHPDICDDSIDRVIGGVHFGKKWKHQVRSSQSALKRRGLIWLGERGWQLSSDIAGPH